MTLPSWKGEVLGATAAETPARSARRARILVVDDEPTVLKVVKRILSRYEIVCIEDARKGLQMLAEGERFDLILSDVMMPHMTGKVFYERLLAEHPEVAPNVVFLTGGATTPLGADLLAAVSNLRLMKPFGIRALESVVEEALAKAKRGAD